MFLHQDFVSVRVKGVSQSTWLCLMLYNFFSVTLIMTFTFIRARLSKHPHNTIELFKCGQAFMLISMPVFVRTARVTSNFS